MKKEFMKMGGAKSEADFYAKYPTEAHFLEAFPQAVKMVQHFQEGGNIPDTAAIGDDLSMSNALRRLYYGTDDYAAQLLRLNPVTQAARGISSLALSGNPYSFATNVLPQFIREEVESEKLDEYAKKKKKRGGELSGAPHNGQPTAAQFFNYGPPTPNFPRLFQPGGESDGFEIPSWAIGSVAAPASYVAAPYLAQAAKAGVKPLSYVVPTPYKKTLSTFQKPEVTGRLNKEELLLQDLLKESDPEFSKLSTAEQRLLLRNPGMVDQTMKVMAKTGMTPSEIAALSKSEKLAKYLSGIKLKPGKTGMIIAGLAAAGAVGGGLYDYFFNQPEPVYEEPVQPEEVEDAYNPMMRRQARQARENRKDGGSAPMNSTQDSVIDNKKNQLLKFIQNQTMKNMNQGGGYYQGGGGTPVTGMQSVTGFEASLGTPQATPANPYNYNPTLMSETQDQNVIDNGICPNGMKWNDQTGRCEKTNNWQDYIPDTEAIVGTGLGIAGSIAQYMERDDDKRLENQRQNRMDISRYVKPNANRQGFNTVNTNYFNPAAMTAGTMSPGPGYVKQGGEMYLTDEQIEYVKRNGGQIEYL